MNLPVKELNRSVDFFTQLGFEFNPQFTDESATCMIVSDEVFVMLLVEDFFRTFTKKQIADAGTHVEAILAITADSRDQVDELYRKALGAGAQESNEPTDQGLMYSRSFQDLDGHLWEVIWMDQSSTEG